MLLSFIESIHRQSPVDNVYFVAHINYEEVVLGLLYNQEDY